MIAEWFWLILTAVCLLWFGSLTFFVGWKGLGQVLRMLKTLKSEDRPG